MTTKRFVAKFGLDNNNQTITNVADPVNSTDVATKSITDSVQSFAQSGFNAANTAASNTVYLQSVSNFSNTRILEVENSVVYLQGVTNQINVSAAFANTWLQSNDALTLSVSKSYTDSSNTSLKSYSDSTFYAKTGGDIYGPVTINSNLLVTGNLTITGNVTSVSANNLSVKDNMIYLNEGATGNANPDIGIAGAYDDGIYHHTGFFRDATDGIWKVFDNYLPEPDASPWIDTSNSSFRIASFQANTGYFTQLTTTSNVSVQGTLNVYSNTAIGVPTGNTAQRPSGSYGLLRYNADTGSFEGYTVSGWGSIGGAIYMANTAPSNPQNGSTWWNTDAGKLLIYYTDEDGSQWVDASPNQAGLLAKPVRQTFIATSGQTAFTVTGGYTPGLVDVFLNGTKLVNGTDVNVTSGSSVILSTGAIIGSTLEVVGLNAASLSNVLPTTGGTLTGDLQVPNLTYTGTLTGSANVINIGSGHIYKDASGNVGIGTSSPSYKLEVVGGDINVSADSHYRIGSGTDRYIKYRTGNSDILYSFSSGNFYRQDITNSAHSWFTGNTERLCLDASGNLGLGVTPASTVAGSLFVKRNICGASTVPFVLYYNSNLNASETADVYINNGFASRYYQNAGAHYWSTAPSGTAGNAISFTQAMTLDSSGNLLVGTTSVTEGGKVSLVGVKSLVAGIPQGQITASDSTALAAGVGGAINFSGVYTSGGSVTSFASVEGYKENATDGNYAGALVFKTRTNGGSQTERARIDSSGQFLLGTTSVVDGNGAQFVNAYNFPRTGAEFRASGTSQHYAITFRNGNGLIGNINTSGTTTSYVTSSDQRLKENIVDSPSALNSINNIKVRSFDWKADGSHVDYGYIAQELLEVVPESVSVPANPEEMMGVDFGKLTPRLVKAIQELSAKVDSLQSELNKLKGVN